LILNHFKKLNKVFSSFFKVFFDFSHNSPFFRLFTLFAAPAIKLKLQSKQTTTGALPKTGHKILLPNKRFDLKSNSQYFDLKSHLDHARKFGLIRSKIFKKMIKIHDRRSMILNL
jgi:hypothetical protein